LQKLVNRQGGTPGSLLPPISLLIAITYAFGFLFLLLFYLVSYTLCFSVFFIAFFLDRPGTFLPSKNSFSTRFQCVKNNIIFFIVVAVAVVVVVACKLKKYVASA